MQRITDIIKDRKGRLKISLDGMLAFIAPADVIVGQGLRVGLELSPQQVTDLMKADEVYRALQTATRYLGYRPRSEKELRERLRRGKYSSATVDMVIVRLRELGLIDDMAFARFWRESRDMHRPQGRWALKQELRRKGIEAEVIDEVVEDIDEESGVYAAASKRACSLRECDEDVFHRRLMLFLRRRGFGYELTRRVVERLWQERLTNGE